MYQPFLLVVPSQFGICHSKMRESESHIWNVVFKLEKLIQTHLTATWWFALCLWSLAFQWFQCASLWSKAHWFVCLFVVCAIFIAKWQWMEFVKNPNWIPDQVRKNPVRNKNKSPVTKISVDIPDTTAEGTGIHPVRVFWNCNGFGFGHQAAVGGSVNQIVCLVIGEENACSKIFACSKNSS